MVCRESSDKLDERLIQIIHSESDVDARRDMKALQTAVRQKLTRDGELERRLQLVENRLLHGTDMSFYDGNSIRSGTDTIVPGPSVHTPSDSTQGPHIGVSTRDFEESLMLSWVYRRTQHREDDVSMRSSVCRQSAWSALSDLSLADLSVLSVIALPIAVEELYSSQWYSGATSGTGALHSTTPHDAGRGMINSAAATQSGGAQHDKQDVVITLPQPEVAGTTVASVPTFVQQSLEALEGPASSVSASASAGLLQQLPTDRDSCVGESPDEVYSCMHCKEVSGPLMPSSSTLQLTVAALQILEEGKAFELGMSWPAPVPSVLMLTE